MDIKILSENARVLTREGYETRRSVEVAIYRDEHNGDEYIRVGQTLLWRKDVLEESDRLTCMASGMTILL